MRFSITANYDILNALKSETCETRPSLNDPKKLSPENPKCTNTNKVKGLGCVSSKNSAGAETRYLENILSTCQNNHSFVEGKV